MCVKKDLALRFLKTKEHALSVPFMMVDEDRISFRVAKC